LLVETALERLSGLEKPSIADLGTGTGCIAITMALEFPAAQVFATDLSPGARDLAATNAELLGAVITILEGQKGNWAAPLESFAPFDALLSNPPYIARGELPELQPEIREYEPLLALDGGEDGLNPYRLMARQCRAILRPGGFLAAELGAGQWQDVAAIFAAEGWQVEPALQDLAGIDRVIVARI
jgi:release factor glutamine methyltransferase